MNYRYLPAVTAAFIQLRPYKSFVPYKNQIVTKFFYGLYRTLNLNTWRHIAAQSIDYYFHPAPSFFY